MIETVTLNAAVDKTVEIDDFNVGAVNRVQSVRLDAGGKGINVSKFIAALGGKSKALGILGGINGEYIKDSLDQCGIENDFVFVKDETRTNLKIIDMYNGTNTDINEPGAKISPEDIKMLEKKIFTGMDGHTILILSGSVPPGVPGNIYRGWIEMAGQAGVKTILDADGELLEEGIMAKPYLIKPNTIELEGLTGRKLGSIEEVVDAAEEVLSRGVENVVVSLGSRGAIFARMDGVIYAEGIKTAVRSTVGAGDSMVAALAFAAENSLAFEDAVTLALASGTANVTTSGSQPAGLDDIMLYREKVKYRYIGI